MPMFRPAAFVLSVLAVLSLARPALAERPAHISFKSPDDVLAEVRRVAVLTGRDDLVKQLDGVLLLSGKRDVAGIDRKKPFGLYVAPRERGGISVVAFVPIADENKF